MKTFVILACIAVACAWPVEREGGDGGGDGSMPSGPEKPEGPIEPLTVDDVMGLLGDVKDFAGEARGHFEQLKTDADAIDGSEASLDDLGRKTQGMVHDLEEMGGERAGQLHQQWMGKMMRLVFAGVEDEGQCHKVLEHLMKFAKEAEERKRQMSQGEMDFWQGVVEAAKKEVGCIIGRFGEFEGMISHVQEAISNPPAGASEEGHAFEAEVLMGSLYFGFGHLYRQVAVFTHVMHALMEHEQEDENEGARSVNQIRALLMQAEKLQSRMDSMRSLRQYGQKAMF